MAVFRRIDSGQSQGGKPARPLGRHTGAQLFQQKAGKTLVKEGVNVATGKCLLANDGEDMCGGKVLVRKCKKEEQATGASQGDFWLPLTHGWDKY